MSKYRSNSIWEAIDSQSYKQALQHVAKALKRNPEDEYVLTLKAYILSLQRKGEEALSIARIVAAKVPTDTRSLDLLFGIIYDNAGYEEAGKIYEEASKKRTRDESLTLSWFWATCTGGDLRGQQKAAMTLHKFFSKRNYTLWTIISYYLLATSKHTTGQEKKLFSALAARLLPLAEPIKTAEEAVLKALVLSIQDDKDNLIEFLTAEETDRWNNLELATLRLDYAVKYEKWQTVFDVALKTLTIENRDDFESWKQFCETGIKLGKTDQVEKLLEERKKTRNGLLAKVHYYSVKGNAFDAALEYFETFGSKQCGFEDLRTYVKSFDEKWLRAIDNSKIDGLNAKVNNRKFYYLLHKSNADYVSTNIRFYNELLPTIEGKLETDYWYGDDLLLTAAWWILDNRPLKHEIPNTDRVLTAIAILETAASRDKHQFYIRAWLVRLYIYLGSFQQAHGHYQKLSIKNIQHDSLSHLLFSRISTVYPVWKPLLATRDIYDTNAVQTPHLIKSAYQNATFSQIPGFLEFSHRLGHSINKGVLCIEAKRVARALGMKLDGLGISPIMQSYDWQENRDFDVLKDVETEGVEIKYRIGPKQSSNWVRAHILKEAIIDDSDESSKVKAHVDGLRSIDTSLEFTKVEIWSLDIVRSLNEPNTLHQLLEEGIKNFIDEDSDFTWEYLHHRFVVLETLKILNESLARSRKSPKLVNPIKNLISHWTESIKEHAKDVKLGREKWASEAAARVSEFVMGLDTSTIDLGSIFEGIAKSQGESITLLRNFKV
ncbi:N-acetyltransferase B complex non catalytic subunit-domain-containing protein [Lipomyces japonicus]|uniref:N-acetyltransferase B complex non catalytic subunit-domain-containing protein n=1 Tax=Lipomyces japonicus TaxID=56871 RepID=UPI0034CE1F5E